MKKTATENKTTRIEWVTKPEDVDTIDDAFWVKKQRWGTFISIGADDLGIITALTEEQCVKATRFYLKGLQDNSFEHNKGVTYSGEVGGKL
jgi:hypothetical protein